MEKKEKGKIEKIYLNDNNTFGMPNNLIDMLLNITTELNKVADHLNSQDQPEKTELDKAREEGFFDETELLYLMMLLQNDNAKGRDTERPNKTAKEKISKLLKDNK
jgi:hypothetical protein